MDCYTMHLFYVDKLLQQVELCLEIKENEFPV